MEAVAAASSIAGLVGLAGQALDGIIKLRGFFKDCASASKTVERFLRDLNSLIQTLEDVKILVVKLEGVAASTFDNKAMISSLQIQLEDCAKDVQEWVGIASEQQAKFSKGSKAIFKKFMVAINKESYADIFREIGNHRDGLALKLNLIGRSLEINHATSLQLLGGKLEDVAVATTSSHRVTAETLQRLEAQLAVDREVASDIPSLRSLASSVSEIVSMLSQPQSPASVQSSAYCSSAGGRKSPLNPGSRRHSAASDVGSNVSAGGGRVNPQRSISDLKSFLNSGKPKLHSYHDRNQPKTDVLSVMSRWKSEHEASQNNNTANPEDSSAPPSYALLESYENFIDMAESICPESLTRYINMVQFSRTIKLHAKLSLSIINASLHDLGEQLQGRDVIKEIYEQLEKLDHDVVLARKSCWEEGYDLEEIDMLLETGCTHDFSHRPSKKAQEGEIEDQGNSGNDLAALQRRLEKLKASRTWSAKQDRINQWLLQNLVASNDEVALHRSFLNSDTELEEREWARQVLKFWPLDGAAVQLGKNIASTNSAVDSLMGHHDVKVLLEIVDHGSELSDGNISDFLNEVGELKNHRWDTRRPRSPLRETFSLVA